MTTRQMLVLMERAWAYFFGGFVLIGCGIFLHPFITMTGLLAVMLGACAAGFPRAIHQPLMWLVSGVMWSISVFIYAVIGYVHIFDFVEGREGVVMLLTLPVATSLIWSSSRLLFSFTRLNWAVTTRHNRGSASSPSFVWPR